MRFETKWLAAAALLLGIATGAQAQEVRVARQFGIAYIPLMIMQDQQLIEKHAARLGVPGVKETVDNVVEMLNDPKVEFSPTPKGIMAFADFMHGTGAIKTKPASWKDAFIPELHGAPGN